MSQQAGTIKPRRGQPKRRSKARALADELSTVTPPPRSNHEVARPDATLASLMRRDFAVVPMTMRVETLTRYLFERKRGSVLVANDHDRVLGSVSLIDIVRDHYLTGGGETANVPHKNAHKHAHKNAVDLMTPFVLALFASAGINEAAALMAAESADQIVVVDHAQRALGIVTALDILRWWAKGIGGLPDEVRPT